MLDGSRRICGIDFTEVVVRCKACANEEKGYPMIDVSDLPTWTRPFGLTRNVTWALMAVLGLLVVLNGVGRSRTPMLTACGVGGLAVALTLQEPLANFFDQMRTYPRPTAITYTAAIAAVSQATANRFVITR
jgi:hypothetical protein